MTDRIVRECGLTGGASAWQLAFTDRTLPNSRPLQDVVPAALDPIPLTLRPVASAGSSPTGSNHGSTGSVIGSRLSQPPALPVTQLEAEEPTKELEPITTPTDRLRSGDRLPANQRGAVRFYSRMNPERVYPMLVVLSREEIEIAIQRHIKKRATRVTKLAVDAPIEIEPVLPGCAVNPPKHVTRLGPQEEVLQFYVVPHVLGPVTGACLRLRQDHATLAELELKARVVQRTMVLIVGLLAFALPLVSAVMNHLGADFGSKEDSNFYLGLLAFFFNDLSPVVLTLALATLTGILFWFTRPHLTEVFWDVARTRDG
ncbi:MAG TPA: hypothetical protein VLM40_05835 [Gemmata sp.]|nr:hypothetical protein [Gemmata sp.]